MCRIQDIHISFDGFFSCILDTEGTLFLVSGTSVLENLRKFNMAGFLFRNEKNGTPCIDDK